MRRLQSIISKILKSKSSMMVTSHLSLPRITMIGDIHIYIENHRGIIRFTSHEIVLNITNGELKIYGSELVIKMLLTTEILIEGEIDTVKIDDKSNKDGVGE